MTLLNSTFLRSLTLHTICLVVNRVQVVVPAELSLRGSAHSFCELLVYMSLLTHLLVSVLLAFKPACWSPGFVHS